MAPALIRDVYILSDKYNNYYAEYILQKFHYRKIFG
jgi:hypothetical protein